MQVIIRLEMKNYNMMFTENQQKDQYCHHEYLTVE